MFMLENTGRTTEASLIRDLRKIIFDVRDLVDKDEITLLKISEEMSRTYDLLAVQLTMLRANPERKWECGLFESYMNELLDFKFLMKPNTPV